MKKVIVGLVMLGGATAIAYASFSGRKDDNKQATEKKVEKKKECRKHCLFS